MPGVTSSRPHGDEDRTPITHVLFDNPVMDLGCTFSVVAIEVSPCRLYGYPGCIALHTKGGMHG